MADQAEEYVPRTWDELFPGRFLKHSHLDSGEWEIRIERVYNTEIDGKLAQVARVQHSIPGVTQRDWGLNKTNGICLRAMFGDTIRDWFGKRVVLRESKVEHGREKGKPCIRICASPELQQPISVVVDFHTKRIKPFVIKIRPGGAGGSNTQRQEPDASAQAKLLAARFRAAKTAEDLRSLALDIEEALKEPATITRDEAKSLMGSVVKREKELAEKESGNVIS